MNKGVMVDPSRDVRDRVAVGSGVVESPDKIWFHKTAAAVIDAGRCVRCGACIAACPSNSISVAADGLPTLTRMCTGCSCCWDFCPLGGLRIDGLEQLWAQKNGNGIGGSTGIGSPFSILSSATPEQPEDAIGIVRAAYQARAGNRHPGAQDGGVATALLTALLSQGYIQGAIVSHKKGPFVGQSVLVTTPEQMEQGAGNVYDQTYPLGELAAGIPEGIEKLALVGTPCQVAGLRALQLFPWRYRSAPVARVELAIALFCSRSFDPQRLMIELVRLGMGPARVAKVDIRDGWFRACDAEGQTVFETRVRGLKFAALRGCDECPDFTGALADIAIGNVGSYQGYTTVLIRTERGAEAWERAAATLEVAPLADLSPVRKLAARNRARAIRLSPRLQLGQRLWIRYSEHLQAYLGTDREPASPPPHRSHHYTVAC